jgi:hypothetical protein
MNAAGVLPILREAFNQRPDWRVYGYTTEPAEEFEIAGALPLALEDLSGAA